MSPGLASSLGRKRALVASPGEQLKQAGSMPEGTVPQSKPSKRSKRSRREQAIRSYKILLEDRAAQGAKPDFIRERRYGSFNTPVPGWETVLMSHQNRRELLEAHKEMGGRSFLGD